MNWSDGNKRERNWSNSRSRNEYRGKVNDNGLTWNRKRNGKCVKRNRDNWI